MIDSRSRRLIVPPSKIKRFFSTIAGQAEETRNHFFFFGL